MHLMSFASDFSCISLLLPIILRSGVHVREWISSHILQLPRNPVLLPFVMKIEACCILHGVGRMHHGSLCHYLNKMFFVSLNML